MSVGIRTTQPLFLARVLDYGPNVNIGAGSLAEVGVPSQSGCMLALSEK